VTYWPNGTFDVAARPVSEWSSIELQPDPDRTGVYTTPGRAQDSTTVEVVMSGLLVYLRSEPPDQATLERVRGEPFDRARILLHAGQHLGVAQRVQLIDSMPGDLRDRVQLPSAPPAHPPPDYEVLPPLRVVQGLAGPAVAGGPSDMPLERLLVSTSSMELPQRVADGVPLERQGRTLVLRGESREEWVYAADRARHWLDPTVDAVFGSVLAGEREGRFYVELRATDVVRAWRRGRTGPIVFAVQDYGSMREGGLLPDALYAAARLGETVVAPAGGAVWDAPRRSWYGDIRRPMESLRLGGYVVRPGPQRGMWIAFTRLVNGQWEQLNLGDRLPGDIRRAIDDARTAGRSVDFAPPVSVPTAQAPEGPEIVNPAVNPADAIIRF
jgi:hypothetical protein